MHGDSNYQMLRDSLDTLRIYEHPSSVDREDRQKLMTGDRVVPVGKAINFFPDNSISTTKYTKYNFFFLNLWEQLQKIANLYFILLILLQCVPMISITGGIPTIAPPLMFIMLLTMIKDVYEDYQRYLADQEENYKKVNRVKGDQMETESIHWSDLHVGDIVKVEKDQFFPADLLLVASSNYKRGVCYVETKNLDGETNLKPKNVLDELKSIVHSEKDVNQLKNQIIKSKGPDVFLYGFEGSIEVKGEQIPLNAKHLLLRGSSLRNTDYIYGVVVYTG